MAHKPENFNLNSKLVRQLKALKRLRNGRSGDEARLGHGRSAGLWEPALGWVLMSASPGKTREGYLLSHRHAVLVDQVTENRYFPLSEISPDQTNV